MSYYPITTTRARNVSPMGGANKTRFIVPSALWVQDSTDDETCTYGAYSAKRHGCFAVHRFETDATNVWIDTLSNAVTACGIADIGVYVNGVWQEALTATVDGTLERHQVTLAAGHKIVELWEGLQSRPVVANANLSTVVASIYGAVDMIPPAMPSRRLVLYGDSITAGQGGTISVRDSFAALVRQQYPGRVSLEAWGCRAVAYDMIQFAGAGGVDGVAARLAALLFGAAKQEIVTLIGTNDYGLALSDAAYFQSHLDGIFTAVHAAVPRAKITCITPLLRTTETTNAQGITLDDIRTASTAAASGKSYVTVVNGKTMVAAGDLSDGLHPNNAGHVKVAAAIKATLGY